MIRHHYISEQREFVFGARPVDLVETNVALGRSERLRVPDEIRRNEEIAARDFNSAEARHRGIVM